MKGKAEEAEGDDVEMFLTHCWENYTKHNKRTGCNQMTEDVIERKGREYIDKLP